MVDVRNIPRYRRGLRNRDLKSLRVELEVCLPVAPDAGEFPFQLGVGADERGAVASPFGADAGLYGAAALALFPGWRTT